MRLMMEVHGLAIDPNSNAPIVILRDKQAGRILPIWIGIIEASAIAFELEKVKFSRPMTHDLFVQALAKLGGAISRVSIVDLKENTYFAEVALRTSAGELVLDARPSDAIALALRSKAPIFCDSAVLDRVQTTPAAVASATTEPATDNSEGSGPKVLSHEGEGTSLDGVLEKLTESDFGKYKM
jgi:bifunctional DNase/RNase